MFYICYWFFSLFYLKCSADLAPATNAYLINSFDTSFTTTKANSIVSNIKFTNNWGQLYVNNELFNGVVYQHQHWDGYDLMNIFAVPNNIGNQIAILYVYCEQSSVVTVYYEDYTYTMTDENASGTCVFLNQTTKTLVQFPAITQSPNPTTQAYNIEITGENISIIKSNGTLVLSDELYNVIVFSTVNCETCPSSDGGWYELHSFLIKQNSPKICFGILYLMLSDHNQVSLEYGFCLPDLDEPSADFKASWTGSLNTYHVPFNKKK